KATPEKIKDEDEREDEEEKESTAEPVASPSVRKMARELGIDLRKVRGSESGGRIVIGDLRNYIQRLISTASKAKTSGAGIGMRPAVAERIDFSQFGP